MLALLVSSSPSVLLVLALTTAVGCYALRKRTAPFHGPLDGLAAAVVVVAALTKAGYLAPLVPAWVLVAAATVAASSIVFRRIGRSVTRAGAVLDRTAAEFALADLRPPPHLRAVEPAASRGGSGGRRSQKTAAS